MISRSRDNGETWDPPIQIHDTSVPDPNFVKTPNGDILCFFVKQEATTGHKGFVYMRSSDNGYTWETPCFLSNPVHRFYASDQFVINNCVIYTVAYGMESLPTDPISVSFWKSEDNGCSWDYVSRVSDPETEPLVNESGVTYIGNMRFLTVLRSTFWGDKTYKKISTDMGNTWGPMIDITDQVGALQYPNIYQIGDKFLLIARQAIATEPGDVRTSTKQTVAFFSDDFGNSFGDPTVIENYNNSQVIDGGYAHAFVESPIHALLTYYTDTTGDRTPDIRLADLFIENTNTENGDLRFREFFHDNPASVPVDTNLSEYILEFKAKSEDAVGGNQFCLGLYDTYNESHIAKWQIPCSSSATSDRTVEIVENMASFPIFDTWNTQTYYKYKSVVNETTRIQSNYIYDADNLLIGCRENMPFAESQAVSLTSVRVGSGTDRRATDSFLSWMLIRKYTDIEPVASVSPTATTMHIPGDLNHDEIVDLKDIIITLKICSGIHLPNVCGGAAVSQNNRIGLNDAVFILQRVSGLR